MTLPLVVLAGSRHRRRAAPAAVHRRPALPRALAPPGDRRERGRPRRGHRAPRSAWRSIAVLAGARRHRARRPRLPPEADRRRSSRRSWPRPGTTTAAISAFMGGPGRQGFEAVATFDAEVVDGAVNGVARRRARERPGAPRPPDRLRPQLRPRRGGRRGRPPRLLPHPGGRVGERAPPRQRGVARRRHLAAHRRHPRAVPRRRGGRADPRRPVPSCTGSWRCCSPPAPAPSRSGCWPTSTPTTPASSTR